MPQPGYVYVLTNSSMNNMVKVGKTRQNPEDRAKALSSSSSVPAPFIVVYQAYFADYDQAEQFVHMKLEKFRVSNNREFFHAPIHEAIDAVIEAKILFGNPTKDSDENKNDPNDSMPIDFNGFQESKKGLYELLDVFIGRSMHGWNDFVKKFGLSMPQFSILMQLHYHHMFSISEIGERFGVSVPAVSQLVEKLVQSGYLERVAAPHDRRAKLLQLSLKGKELIEAGMAQRYNWMNDLTSALNAEEQAKIAEALEILTKAAQGLDDKK